MIDLERTPAGSPKAQGRAAAVVLFALACCGGVGRLVAQAPRESVRTVEPRLTRIFGSDSMEMWSPALSPDGRWVAFVDVYRDGPDAVNLWVVSTTGGAPVRLTAGRYFDVLPTWFPSGDRIAFRSNRASQNVVMTMPFDPQTGQAAGPPRQVTLEPPGRFVLSPDGRWVAYFTHTGRVHRLNVVPAEGGAIRQLLQIDDSTAVPSQWGGSPPMVWSANGESVYFVLDQAGTHAQSIMRVRAAGGNAQEVALLPPQVSAIYLSPDARYVFRRIRRGAGQDDLSEVTTIDGRTIARLALPKGMWPQRFTPDGRGLVAALTHRVAPIRVVPVAGGPVRQLTEAREYDWPVGWSPDGSRLFLRTRIDGRAALLDVPVAGGPSVQWLMPADAGQPGTISADGRYVTYSLDSANREQTTLVVRRLADGHTRVITRAAYVSHSVYSWGSPGATGPGGAHTNGDEFLYFERRGDRLDLWASAPEGPSRMLRSFPIDYFGRTGFGVHGNRVAYTARRGDSTAVFVAEGRNGTPRHLFSMAGSFTQPVWSHDGRWLAFSYDSPGPPPRHGVLLVGVSANGTVAVSPRIVEVGGEGWQIQWLPDDHALTVMALTPGSDQTQVFLVSLREGEPPVALTRDDPSTRWGYELSPDGRYVAYPAEISRGSSLWLVDLGEVLAPAEGRRGTRR
jgi:Tol biopolymer transport system component